MKFQQEALNLEEAICGEEEDYRLWTNMWELVGSQLTEAHVY